MTRLKLIRAGRLDLAGLSALARRPDLFPPREENFWTDPYISTQMLAAHLDAGTDAASRRPETIRRSVEWIAAVLRLPIQAEVLDLGCGPGLYTAPLARRGLRVTGLDFSASSIDYARRCACEQGLEIDYRLQDYLTLAEHNRFDAALLIYYDLGPLSDLERDDLLARVWRSLKPGGAFVFDVMTGFARSQQLEPSTWRVCAQPGFWRPNPYLELRQAFHYPQQQVWLDRYIIVDESGETVVYHSWDHYYTPDTLRPILERAGFALKSLHSDLTGEPFQPDSPSMAVIARKVDPSSGF